MKIFINEQIASALPIYDRAMREINKLADSLWVEENEARGESESTVWVASYGESGLMRQLDEGRSLILSALNCDPREYNRHTSRKYQQFVEEALELLAKYGA